MSDKDLQSDEIVMATMSELILFLLFYCLILLGGLAVFGKNTEGASRSLPLLQQSEDATAAIWYYDFTKDPFFSLGNAKLSEEMLAELDDLSDALLTVVLFTNADIVAIEVYGHADPVPVLLDNQRHVDPRCITNGGNSYKVSIDCHLVGAMDPKVTDVTLADINHGSNVDLGMIRAAIVTNFLAQQTWVKEKDISVLPFSGGSTIHPPDSEGVPRFHTAESREHLNLDNEEEMASLRRIEVRFRGGLPDQRRLDQ